MRLISVKDLKLGDTLGKTLYTADGRVLLSKGVSLTGTFISKLNQIGLKAVYIEDPRFQDVQATDALSEQVRREATARVRELYDAILIDQRGGRGTGRYSRPGAPVDSRPLKRSASDIIEDVLRHDNAVFSLAELRSKQGWLMPHSVQVALIATIIGQALGLNRMQLEELATGALLHDAGMAFLPTELQEKSPLEYTPEERALYENHAQLGFDFIRKKTDFSLIVAHVAYQHHECINGGGFPRAITGEDIHPYAKILHVADYYDELINGVSSRPSLPPHVVYEIIMGLANQTLDMQVVEAFTRHVGAYPTGFTVRLNNGETAVVIDQNALATRPKVRVLREYANSVEGTEYDLCQNLTLFITEVLV